VVNESGEEAAVFRLEQNAVLPLVDVGRVFGMAAKRVLGVQRSTVRDGAALMPETSRFSEKPETCESCSGSKDVSGSVRAQWRGIATSC
jgi:hypothetical protein